MNWAELKDLVSHMCLGGSMIASWSLTQEVAGWQLRALLLEFLTIRPNCTFLAHIYIRQVLVDPFKYN